MSQVIRLLSVPSIGLGQPLQIDIRLAGGRSICHSRMLIVERIAR